MHKLGVRGEGEGGGGGLAIVVGCGEGKGKLGAISMHLKNSLLGRKVLLLNPYWADVLIFYLLKTSENQIYSVRKFSLDRKVENSNISSKWVRVLLYCLK